MRLPNGLCILATSLISNFLIAKVAIADIAQTNIGGLIDLRAVNADDTRGWLYEGQGKQRFDSEHDGIKLGQAILEIKNQLGDTLNSKLVFNGYDERNHFADITEAYVQWKPLPFDGYRFKTRVGAFFPTLSLENGGIGWTNPWMLSTSAINTWVGEELRTIGTELSFSRPGQLNDSAHDFEIISSVFIANDPAGGLITWRGWTVGDRITGLTETLPYPEMPSVYGSTGIFRSQISAEKPFYEIDHHYGYYVGANYGYNNWFTLRTLHYDNNGDPLKINKGQWAWATSFNHIAMRVDFTEELSLLTQFMKGSTQFGNQYFGVNADYDAWYALLSKSFGKNRVSARYDKFKIIDLDHMPGDNNSENGHAVALTWQYKFNESNQTGVEYLKIKSERAAREYLGYSYDEEAGEMPIMETSVQLFYRYKF